MILVFFEPREVAIDPGSILCGESSGSGHQS